MREKAIIGVLSARRPGAHPGTARSPAVRPGPEPPRDGQVVGPATATHDALMGSGRPDRFIKAGDKINELVDHLFAG